MSRRVDLLFFLRFLSRTHALPLGASATIVTCGLLVAVAKDKKNDFLMKKKKKKKIFFLLFSFLSLSPPPRLHRARLSFKRLLSRRPSPRSLSASPQTMPKIQKTDASAVKASAAAAGVAAGAAAQKAPKAANVKKAAEPKLAADKAADKPQPTAAKPAAAKPAAKPAAKKAAKKPAKKLAPKKKGGIGVGKLTPTKAAPLKLTIDCSTPANDGILDVAAFEKYLHDRIKVDGKAGMTTDKVTISRKDGVITVTATVPYSKRALKYLAKKFLKKNLIRDWLRVVAKGSHGYTLRYFAIHQDGDDGSDDDEAEN
jgi:large subunit ribosomal protein L22e